MYPASDEAERNRGCGWIPPGGRAFGTLTAEPNENGAALVH